VFFELLAFINKFLTGPWLYVAAGALAAGLAGLFSLCFRAKRNRNTAFLIALTILITLALVGAHALEQWWCCSHPWGDPLPYQIAALPSDYTAYWGKVAAVFVGLVGAAALAMLAALLACAMRLGQIKTILQNTPAAHHYHVSCLNREKPGAPPFEMRV